MHQGDLQISGDFLHLLDRKCPASPPLSGITVIELGHSVAAPYACEILGDLGADVIKVEKADGDDARKMGAAILGRHVRDLPSFNRNKRSVVVNFKDPAERERLAQAHHRARRCRRCRNLRPGSAAEFGLDARRCAKLKPSLIYCTIGAFGRAGPLKDRPATIL